MAEDWQAILPVHHRCSRLWVMGCIAVPPVAARTLLPYLDVLSWRTTLCGCWRVGTYLWASPPGAADVAIDQLLDGGLLFP
jgi:hypothetical protein